MEVKVAETYHFYIVSSLSARRLSDAMKFVPPCRARLTVSPPPEIYLDRGWKDVDDLNIAIAQSLRRPKNPLFRTRSTGITRDSYVRLRFCQRMLCCGWFGQSCAHNLFKHV
jgi:hypothetical protein